MAAQAVDVFDGGFVKLRPEHVGLDVFDHRFELADDMAIVVDDKIQYRIQRKARPVAQLLGVFLCLGADRGIAGRSTVAHADQEVFTNEKVGLTVFDFFFHPLCGFHHDEQ
ncbi:hypothetical protein D3C75_1178920 [compost metagenome]